MKFLLLLLTFLFILHPANAQTACERFVQNKEYVSILESYKTAPLGAKLRHFQINGKQFDGLKLLKNLNTNDVTVTCKDINGTSMGSLEKKGANKYELVLSSSAPKTSLVRAMYHELIHLAHYTMAKEAGFHKELKIFARGFNALYRSSSLDGALNQLKVKGDNEPRKTIAAGISVFLCTEYNAYLLTSLLTNQLNLRPLDIWDIQLLPNIKEITIQKHLFSLAKSLPHIKLPKSSFNKMMRLCKQQGSNIPAAIVNTIMNEEVSSFDKLYL